MKTMNGRCRVLTKQVDICPIPFFLPQHFSDTVPGTEVLQQVQAMVHFAYESHEERFVAKNLGQNPIALLNIMLTYLLRFVVHC